MKMTNVRRRAAILGCCLLPAAASAREWDVSLGGLAQPQLRWEQQDPNVTETNPRNSGFALHRARLIAAGSVRGYSILWEARVEMEMVPSFQLLDAWLSGSADLPGRGHWRITAGQHFAPFSRQTILPANTLQMNEFAQLVSLTPGRQLGVSATLEVPYAPSVMLSAGIFNGKGINIVENLDQNLMYVGRIAYRPIGQRAPLLESALGPDAVWVAADVSYTKKRQGDFNEFDLLLGADAFFSWKGLSAYVEYLWGNITYSAGAPKQSFHEQGFNAQAGYLLPIPGRLFRRFEVAFRFEAVAPNQTVPITGPGDPTQARAAYVAGINYFHRGHNLKLQLNYSHNQELDDIDVAGRKASYDNDSVVLQLTYRLE
ncbi:MAG: Phosphate-selective porin [bacterium]|nr:Phosphate-selective porin [bacterium]